MNCFKPRRGSRRVNMTHGDRKGAKKSILVPNYYVPLFTLAHVVESSIGFKSTVGFRKMFSRKRGREGGREGGGRENRLYYARGMIVAVVDEGARSNPARMDDPETKGATLDN